MRFTLLILCLIAFGLLTWQTELVMRFALENSTAGWMTSYLLPIALGVFLLITSLVLLWKSIPLNRLPKVIVSILLAVALMSSYLIFNPPYINDWHARGEKLDEGHFLSAIECGPDSTLSDFTGLIMLALPDCPYCIEAAENLKILQHRTDSSSVRILLASNSENYIRSFINRTQVSVQTISACSNIHVMNDLSQGRYPAYLRVEEGEIVYRWSNGQFGYPALDMVENGLN